MNQANETADAFYNEDWQYFKERFGKLPICHAEAEMIMDKALRRIDLNGYDR